MWTTDSDGDLYGNLLPSSCVDDDTTLNREHKGERKCEAVLCILHTHINLGSFKVHWAMCFHMIRRIEYVEVKQEFDIKVSLSPKQKLYLMKMCIWDGWNEYTYYLYSDTITLLFILLWERIGGRMLMYLVMIPTKILANKF